MNHQRIKKTISICVALALAAFAVGARSGTAHAVPGAEFLILPDGTLTFVGRSAVMPNGQLIPLWVQGGNVNNLTLALGTAGGEAGAGAAGAAGAEAGAGAAGGGGAGGSGGSTVMRIVSAAGLPLLVVVTTVGVFLLVDCEVHGECISTTVANAGGWSVVLGYQPNPNGAPIGGTTVSCQDTRSYRDKCQHSSLASIVSSYRSCRGMPRWTCGEMWEDGKRSGSSDWNNALRECNAHLDQCVRASQQNCMNACLAALPPPPPPPPPAQNAGANAGGAPVTGQAAAVPNGRVAPDVGGIAGRGDAQPPPPPGTPALQQWVAAANACIRLGGVGGGGVDPPYQGTEPVESGSAGCGCSASPSAAQSAPWLALGLALLLSRRRRRDAPALRRSGTLP